MSKQIELLRWMRNKKLFATHDVIKWGLENYYNRANRTKREFLDQGLITQLPEWKKEVRGFNCKDAVYEADEKEIAKYFQPSWGFQKVDEKSRDFV
jgi:hypothetical protein